MAEQLLKTCYSFVIYNKDFSNCLCDAEGNTVAHGTQDISGHVGTHHWTAKSVIEAFRGQINPGDVFMVNDPYLGGTHNPDVRLVRPVFVEGELICFLQSCGHWADIGGHIPGGFDIEAKDFYAEGIRIPPLKIWDRGEFRWDVANLLVTNMRVPEDRLGDLHAQAAATQVGEKRVLELVERYGKDTILAAFSECQDYVERIMRARVSELPDGTWEAVDFMDSDPSKPESMIPIRVKLTIKGDELHFDFEGTHPQIGSNQNASFGVTWSGIVAATKTLFPDVLLSSGFYRPITVNLPEGTVVNATQPAAVSAGTSGVFEKVMNAVFAVWSQIVPERSLAGSYNLEYLMVGGEDTRRGRGHFMWYDWLAGGWGGRYSKDGSNATAPVFGVGVVLQSCEVQERLTPVLIKNLEMVCDSAGPGYFRGGVGVDKGGIMRDCGKTVVSYSSDRARSVPMGLSGGMPSNPQGLWLNPGTEGGRFLGANFSGVDIFPGDHLSRPAAGGGGYGDPLKRPVESVLEDVIDGYVSIRRAALDYGVVIVANDVEVDDYSIDQSATDTLRASLAAERKERLAVDPQEVRERYLAGEIDLLDTVRHYGVLLDRRQPDCPVLEKTTTQFRETLQEKMVPFWN
jgi:N-methylhydantoinase B